MFLKENIIVLLLVGISTIVHSAFLVNGAPPPSPEFYQPQEFMERNPEYLLRTLARLRQALTAEEELENSKRGLDLGLSRGYSGSQAAKHLMGLAAANFAGGPGRRRRNDNED